VKLDLHLHTNASKDSNIKIEKLAKILIKKGLNGCAITDHNTTKNIGKAKTIFKKFDLILIPGIEISCKEGDLIGLFIEEEIKRGIGIEEAIDIIRESGGISIIPHPFDIIRSSLLTKILYLNFDCIEVFNSRSIARMDYLLKNFKKKTLVAGSDAHFLMEVGNSYTEIFEEDLYKGLKKGKTRVYGKYSPRRVHIYSLINKIYGNIRSLHL